MVGWKPLDDNLVMWNVLMVVVCGGKNLGVNWERVLTFESYCVKWAGNLLLDK